jgi:hypothetical protein
MPARRNGPARNIAKRITEEEFAEAMRWLSPLAPARRLEEAARLAKLKPAERYCDDPDIAAAADFLAALEACGTRGEQARVLRRWPDIVRASEISARNGTQRWAVEAWILHGLADCEIADRCGLKPEVVRVYESLFFAMREFLSEREALAQKLFGSAFSLIFRNSEVGRLWAYVGLTQPAAALTEFIDSFHAARERGTPPELSVYLRAGAPVSLEVQSFVAHYLLSNNVEAAPIYFHCHVGLIEAQRETDPKRREEMKEKLKRVLVEYARGVLAGKTERQLQRLLRHPPKRSQARKSVASAQEQPMKSALAIPTTAASHAELVAAKEIDRLLLPAKFDIGVLRAGSNHSG